MQPAVFKINAAVGVTGKLFLSVTEFPTELLKYVLLYILTGTVLFFLSISPSSHGEPVGTRRKLYSAVPGRHFVVVRPYTAQAEGEINLYKNDRVKGEADDNLSLLLVCVYLCFCIVTFSLLTRPKSASLP